MAQRPFGEAPFSIGRLWRGVLGGVSRLIPYFFESVSVFSRLRRFRFFGLSRLRRFRIVSFWFRVWLWFFFCAAVSFLCLVNRARHAATALRNYLRFIGAVAMSQKVRHYRRLYRVWESLRVCHWGKSGRAGRAGRRPSIPRFGGYKRSPRSRSGAPKGGPRDTREHMAKKPCENKA